MYWNWYCFVNYLILLKPSKSFNNKKPLLTFLKTYSIVRYLMCLINLMSNLSVWINLKDIIKQINN